MKVAVEDMLLGDVGPLVLSSCDARRAWSSCWPDTARAVRHGRPELWRLLAWPPISLTHVELTSLPPCCRPGVLLRPGLSTDHQCSSLTTFEAGCSRMGGLLTPDGGSVCLYD